MKKNILILFVVTCLCKLSYGQKTSGDFEFGLHTGYNSSHATSSSIDDYKWVGGFNAGAGVDYYFSESWSVRARLTYDQKGWGSYATRTIPGSTTIELTSENFKLNYITLPLTANWHFTEQKNWNLSFGPYVGILTSGKANGSDVKQYLNTTDAGLALGVGLKIPISENTNLFFELDNQIGATNVIKPEENYYDSYLLLRGSFNVGLSF